MANIPAIKNDNGIPTLYVKDVPFFALSGEIHNSSSSSLQYMESEIWPKLKGLHMNSLIVPLYWETIEPQEGEYHFELLDGLLKQARENKMKLIFLWFGLWKNSESMYVPAWIGFFLMYINPTSNLPYLLGVSFLCGLCNSAASICFGMVSDSIEYGDWKLGRRQEGIAASMLSFGVKISTAICGSAGVLLLSAAGYVAGAEQTEAAKTGINVVVNLLPLVIAALSMLPLFFYKLTPSRVAEIRTDLDAGKHAWDK